MPVQPYLFFEGRCEEALEFYRGALDAEVVMMLRYKESPDPEMSPPGAGEKIMHSEIKIGGTVVMASDGMCTGKPAFQGFSLALTPPDETAGKRLFAALGNGGQVQMPLGKTFFSPCFGIVADKFGVSWMIMVEP